jgi:hypothetical protein
MDVRQILPAGAAFLVLCAAGALSASPRVTAALEADSQGIAWPQAGDPVGAVPGNAGPAENPFRNIPLESLSATKERPLFSVTRRPPPSAAPTLAQASPRPAQARAPAPSKPDGPPLALIGTITGAGRPVAVLFNKLTRVVSTTHEGDEALGWRITTVSSRSATAEKDGVSVTLNLPRTGEPAEPTSTAGAEQ